MIKLISSAWRGNPVLFAGLVWLSCEFFLAGPFSFLRNGDNADSFIPGFMAYARLFPEGAYWFPFAGAGTDRLALGYFGGLDTFLFWLLPGWLAVQVFVVAQFVLGGGVTYLICRKTLNLEREAATFAALAFALNALPGAHDHNMAMFFPALIWAISRGLDESLPWMCRAAWLVVAPLAYGMSTLAAFLLPFPFIMVAVWFAVIDPKSSVRQWVLIATACFMAVLPRLQDIAALILHAPISHRAHWGDLHSQTPEMMDIFSHLAAFPTSLGLNLLLLVLAFCAWMLRGPSGKEAPGKMWSVSAAFVLLLLAPPLITFLRPLLVLVFPFAAGFHFGRIALLLPFFAALMGGLGLQALMGRFGAYGFNFSLVGPLNPGRAAYLVGIGLLALISLEAKYGHAYEWVKYGNYIKNFSNPVIENFVTEHPLADDPYRIAAYQLYPAHYQAYGLETAGGYMNLYSRRYRDFWARVVAPREKQQGQEGRFLNWGSRVNLSADIREPRLRLGDHYNLSLLSLANVRYVFARDQLLDQQFFPSVTADKPWNMSDDREKTMIHITANLGSENPLYIYRNTEVLPRFFLVPSVREFTDESSLLDAMSGAGVAALWKSVFVEKGWLKEDVASGLGFGDGAVELVSYKPDHIELDLRADGPAILAVANSYSPYWRARVDGGAAEIFPAYPTFWGVAVAAGAHRVVFDYVPPYRLW